MPSGVYTTIALDPFLQEFLRAQFNQYDPVFTFSKGHDLLLRLERYLTIPPRDFKPVEYGQETFRIEIPYMELKNPSVHFFISDRKQKIFSSRVRDYFREIFHDEMRKSRSRNESKKEAIICFMEDYRISDEYEDRLVKAYNRYMEIERQRRFRRRRKQRKMLSVEA
jgi:hypothetical protein